MSCRHLLGGESCISSYYSLFILSLSLHVSMFTIDSLHCVHGDVYDIVFMYITACTGWGRP